TAGKIGLSDVLVFRRELVEGRREQLETTAQAWQARLELDLAAGMLPVPASLAPSSALEPPEIDR
ncbi:MAG: hypothetical protein ACRD0X_01195, partial [Thermoanaerobaculia bacterium]